MKFAAVVSCCLLAVQATHHHHGHRKPKAHPRAAEAQKAQNPSGIASPLPAVSALLNPASETLRSLNAKASILEAQTNIQLSREREAFSARLTGLGKQNKQLTADIQVLTSETDTLRKHANQLRDANRLMRKELHASESGLTNARDFSSDALRSSDDSHAEDLRVLQPAGKKVSLVAMGTKDQGYDDQESDESEDQGDDDDSESDDQGASFLALSSRIQHRALAAATAGEAAAMQMSDIEAVATGRAGGLQGAQLLEVLSKNIADLAKQQRHSEEQLKGAYDTKLNALLAEQRSLNATKASLLSLRTKLTTAEAHLERTNSQLQKQLRGLGLFLQKLTHMILAPADEVEHQLQKLPKDVAAILPPGAMPKARPTSQAVSSAKAKLTQNAGLRGVQID